MTRSEDDPPKGKRALGLSVLLHVCAAPLFVAIFAGWSIPLPDVASVTTTSYATTIEHRTPRRAPSRAIASTAAPRHVFTTAVPRERAAARTVEHAARRPSPAQVPQVQRVAMAAPPAPAAPATNEAPRAAEKAPAGVAMPVAPTASPEPTASPAPPMHVVAAAAAGGWGQNFRDPAVMDDDALTALRSRYHGAVARVDVDEEGHAVRVVVDGPLDPDARAEIERQLGSLRYMPAECNGLRCAASLQIKV